VWERGCLLHDRRGKHRMSYGGGRAGVVGMVWYGGYGVRGMVW